MVKQAKWECEKCYKQYDSEESAVGCEIGHINPTSIKQWNWRPKEIYPERISVEFPGGTVRDYYAR